MVSSMITARYGSYRLYVVDLLSVQGTKTKLHGEDRGWLIQGGILQQWMLKLTLEDRP